ncbi:RepA [Sugarcane streak virus]|uniref:Replication-associated protein n=1 Tax=Sugarcane streak virus TaxID=10836 RepID=B0Z3X5_9GEMI|nr:RepA [Sugarcane streak virus]
MSTVGSSMSSAPVRRFKHRNVNTFLTYPRCNLDPEAVGLIIWNLISHWNPAYILSVRETHEDGGYHIHVLAQSVKPVYTTDPAFFDIDNHHPNIQSGKSANKIKAYITKKPVSIWEKGTFIPRKTSFQGDSTEPNSKKQSKDDIVRDIIEHSTNKQEYLSMIQKALPYEWATKLQYFEYSANKLFPDTQEIYTSPFPRTTPNLLDTTTINTWLQNNLYQVSPQAYMLTNPSCLTLEEAASDLTWMAETSRILIPTGSSASTSSGQQERASQHGQEAWEDIITGRTTSTGSSYDEDAEYNIIDDIPFKYCPCWKQLIGCQKDYIVNPKYGKRKKVAHKSIPTIVLANEDEDWFKDMSPAQQDYFNANCTTYMLEPGERFFSPPAVSATAHPSDEV